MQEWSYNYSGTCISPEDVYLAHHGVKGMKWGVRHGSKKEHNRYKDIRKENKNFYKKAQKKNYERARKVEKKKWKELYDYGKKNGINVEEIISGNLPIPNNTNGRILMSKIEKANRVMPNAELKTRQESIDHLYEKYGNERMAGYEQQRRNRIKYKNAAVGTGVAAALASPLLALGIKNAKSR